jgi:hypothetical protein
LAESQVSTGMRGCVERASERFRLGGPNPRRASLRKTSCKGAGRRKLARDPCQLVCDQLRWATQFDEGDRLEERATGPVRPWVAHLSLRSQTRGGRSSEDKTFNQLFSRCGSQGDQSCSRLGANLAPITRCSACHCEIWTWGRIAVPSHAVSAREGAGPPPRTTLWLVRSFV